MLSTFALPCRLEALFRTSRFFSFPLSFRALPPFVDNAAHAHYNSKQYKTPSQRLAKEIEKAEKNIAGLKGKLSNENFVSRAPEAVVQAERDKLSKAESLLQQLQESQARLKK